MTAARWVCLIVGFLIFAGTGYSTDPNPPNLADVLIVFVIYGGAVALIALPVILEFLERRNNK